MIDRGVALHVVQPADDGAAKAVQAGVLHGFEDRQVGAFEVLQDLPGLIRRLPSSTTTISMGDAVQPQFHVRML